MIDNLFQNRNLRGSSSKWANWMSRLSVTSCQYCVENHGKIVDIVVLGDRETLKINAHLHCYCIFVPMRTKKAGTATKLGANGADVSLAYFQKLPGYYVTKEVAEDSGWKNWKGNLDKVLPGKMIGGNVYHNKEKKLPDISGRVWYEVDINYTEGLRNRQRILYSNDGLVFVTYDHYQTFYEITY